MWKILWVFDRERVMFGDFVQRDSEEDFSQKWSNTLDCEWTPDGIFQLLIPAICQVSYSVIRFGPTRILNTDLNVVFHRFGIKWRGIQMALKSPNE
jgi:hypothetical protein